MTRIDSSATELRESMMAVTRQMRRHRPDHGLTLSQMELLGEVSRTGVTTPAELANRLHVRVQSLTDSINELLGRDLIARRPDETDRRRQLIELTKAGTMISNATFRPFVVYGLVAVIYFVICYPLTRYARTLERKWNAAR